MATYDDELEARKAEYDEAYHAELAEVTRAEATIRKQAVAQAEIEAYWEAGARAAGLYASRWTYLNVSVIVIGVDPATDMIRYILDLSGVRAAEFTTSRHAFHLGAQRADASLAA